MYYHRNAIAKRLHRNRKSSSTFQKSQSHGSMTLREAINRYKIRTPRTLSSECRIWAIDRDVERVSGAYLVNRVDLESVNHGINFVVYPVRICIRVILLIARIK